MKKSGLRYWIVACTVGFAAAGYGCRTTTTSGVKDATAPSDASDSTPAPTTVTLGACGTPTPCISNIVFAAGVTCTAVDGQGTQAGTGSGGNFCVAGNDLQTNLCGQNLNPPDYTATCAIGAGSGNTSGTLACRDVSNGCPAGQVVQTTGCASPHFVVAGGKPITYGRCVRSTGMPPGALGMPLNPGTCQPIQQLNCPSGQAATTSGCASPHFVTAGGQSVTYGRCAASGMPPGALGMPAVTSCPVAVRGGAFAQWRTDGGSDNDPAVKVKAQADGTYAVTISGEETGEFDYVVTVTSGAGGCSVSNWSKTN